MATSSPTRTPGKSLALSLGLTAGLSIILVALLSLFILPSLKSGPQNLKIGVVATAQDATTVTEWLDENRTGDYVPVEYDTRADLEADIRAHAISGGVVVDGTEMQVLVTSAGSTAMAGSLTSTGTALALDMQLMPAVEDVVPLPDTDPTGIGIGGLAFPLVFGGIVPAVAFRAIFAGRRKWIFGGLMGFSIVGGLVVAAVLKFMFGSFEGNLLPVAASVSLGIAALALPLAGLQECFGGKGFTIAAMLMMFVGNPFAGIATGAQWLPSGVAMIGQLLPPGAAGTLVRSAAYFGGAGGATALIVLSCWVATGLALWFLAPVLKRKSESVGSEAAEAMASAPASM